MPADSTAPTDLPAEPDGFLAARLVERAMAAGMAGLIHLARSETRAARLHAAATALAPDLRVERLPGWDCPAYDRVSPARAVMGARMATLARLAGAAAPTLLIAPVDSATQRLPAPETVAVLHLRPGDPIDPAALRRHLRALGYQEDELAATPGDTAWRGEVIDIFPADAAFACRVRHAAGRITALHRIDPASQRSQHALPGLAIAPASEVILPEDRADDRVPGIEHALPLFQPRLVTVFDLLPHAALTQDPEVPALRALRWTEVTEAYRGRLVRAAVPPPERLFLDDAAWTAALAGRTVRTASGAGPPPLRFAGREDAEEACADAAAAILKTGGRVALAGSSARAGTLRRLLAAEHGRETVPVADWPALRATPPGTLAVLPGALPAGFVAPEATVIALPDMRPEPAAESGAARAFPAPALRPGDAVIHIEHGLARLGGVEPVQAGAVRVDCLRLDYAGGASLLVPPGELDRIWRYGGEAGPLRLDHLHGDGWTRRRAEMEAEIARIAAALATLARARAAARAPALRPPAAYTRFAARFPYALTPDQETAIEAVLADLASGHPMDRLVCGDVGYGKTEVALRVAAVAALSGRQAALLAPTTVLVRQHLHSFTRRFAGFGVRVAALSRFSTPEEARATRAGLADGSIGVVIGTQALAGRDVRFHDLALLVIDEEQRFGARQKAMLKRLRAGLHVLTLTATPIPRTLQAALIGLQDLSVIATPPARRQPVRTALLPLDEDVLRAALAREHRRGGQSFVVCPRIEDLPSMAGRLRRLVPDLSLITAHGEMPAAALDEAVLRFAEGGGDVLLSTNIVENGLDIPRANTMTVWRADRFGLAELHQLRGRVGRGAARGTLLMLTDPTHPPGPTTLRRLRTLETEDRPGAGFAISARDLDLRGAGDLLGAAQAGHVRLIGPDLYQHWLRRAALAARGEAVPEEWTPHIAIAVDAFIPPGYIPDEAQRVTLHLRLGVALRLGDLAGLDALEAEITDRFGEPPPPVRGLLALSRLRARCRRLGVQALEAGPHGVAAHVRGEPPTAAGLERDGHRLLLRQESDTPDAMLRAADALLDRIGRRS